MNRSLSTIRAKTPFSTPPRVLVLAEEGHAQGALALADALDQAGADTEVRFGDERNLGHALDAVVVAGPRGYRVDRHHPVLESVRSHFRA